MKERIIQIMEAEKLTPSLFADKLNIGRAVISHILNGRNNPSLDVVMRILDTIVYIDADWLLSGKGNMRKSDNHPLGVDSSPKPIHTTNSTDLFDNRAAEPIENITDNNIASTKELQPQATAIVSTESNLIPNSLSPIIGSNKKISKVIIYYADNTFQAFNPENSPL